MKSFIAALLGLVVSSTSSMADVIPGTQREILGWQLAAYEGPNGGFSHCGMYIGYRSGIFMHFSIFGNYTWRIGWMHADWRFTPGQQVNISLFVDGIGPQNLTAVARTKTFATADLPATAGIFDLMRKGYQMTVFAEGNQYKFNLDGTYAALTELVTCVNRFTQTARAPAPPMVPSGQGAPSARALISAEERLEATKVVANILAQGEMSGFRILSAQEVAELKSDYFSKSDVVWKAEGVIGTLRIIPKSTAASAKEVATSVVADDLKNCKGQFASGSTKDEKSPEVLRVFTGCQTGSDSYEYRYTVLPLGNGSYYLFAMASKVDSGEHGTGAAKAEVLLRQAVYDVMKK